MLTAPLRYSTLSRRARPDELPGRYSALDIPDHEAAVREEDMLLNMESFIFIHAI